MGLTRTSTGKHSIDTNTPALKSDPGDIVIALAGNPNVGKSTVFNALTGMNQHTGNWTGKTVATACGSFRKNGKNHILVDLPGTYSLFTHSVEEEVARDFILSENADACIVVCDATCLERNLNLVLQIIEITPRTVVCINLMDEAKRKKISVDIPALSLELGVPVIGTSARSGKGLDELIDAVDSVISKKSAPIEPVHYGSGIEEALKILTPALSENSSHPRRDAMRILSREIEAPDPAQDEAKLANEVIDRFGLTHEMIRDKAAIAAVMRAEDIFKKCVTTIAKHSAADRKLDRIFTGRAGIFAMLLLLATVLWLTVYGANYPSNLLFSAFDALGAKLRQLLYLINAPDILTSALIDGVYRVLTWVVAVMLPPMAIFFPLFTLLEDSGYLPRVAFNLDHRFKKSGACGKQALTMCMGFGCNAAGVTGCRIIDSPRERLMAAVTNGFVPCNGRFPTLISLISLFIVGALPAPFDSFAGAALLTALIVLSVFATFAACSLLSKTILRGVPSSFTLELPPYRRPQIGKVIVRSVFDRTLFVLGRAAAVAAPAGLIIWITANIKLNGTSIFSYCSDFLDPIARLFGMDGVILTAFILGFPANETVVPIMLMGYLADSSISQTDGAALHSLLTANGWDIKTAICVIIFMLFHWPCSTTLITVKKRDGQHEMGCYRRTSANRRRAYIMFCRVSYFRADLREQTGNFRKLFYCIVRLYVAVVFYSFGIEPDGCYPGIYAAFYVRAQAVSDYDRFAEREIGYLRKADIKELLVRLIGAENLRDKYAVHIFCDSGASYPALLYLCGAV